MLLSNVLIKLISIVECYFAEVTARRWMIFSLMSSQSSNTFHYFVTLVTRISLDDSLVDLLDVPRQGIWPAELLATLLALVLL